MKIPLHLLAGPLMALAPSVFAQGETSPLARSVAVFNERWMALEHADREKLDALRAKSEASLQALEKEVQAEGDLDGVLACRVERERMKNGGTPLREEPPPPPREIPLDAFTGGYRDDQPGILGAMGPPIPDPILDLDLEEGLHRFIVIAAQDKVGDEDALMDFSVGDILKESVRVPQPRDAPGRYEFQGTFPAGPHRVTIGFANDHFNEEPREDRNLLILGFTHVPPPGRTDGVSEHPKVAAFQAAWARDAEAAEKACLPARGELVKKYLEALNGIAANLNRSTQTAEIEKVRVEMERAKGLLPADLVASLQLGSIGTDPRPPPGRLALLYSFNAASGGLVRPAGGAGPALRLEGKAQLLPIPNCGCVLSLSGTNDYLVATSAEGMDLDKKSLTLSFYSQDLSSRRSTILRKGGEDDAARMSVGYRDGALVFRVGPDTLRWTPPGDLEAWKHLLLVYNRATRRQIIYLDGREAASGPVSGEMAGSDGQPLMIGHDPFNAAAGFNGRLNQLRIFDRALQPHEITSLCNQEKIAHDLLQRNWFGAPPRSPRDLESLLEKTHWILKIEAGSSPGENRLMRFRPGGTMSLSGSDETYHWKASSARVVEVWRNRWDGRENIYKFEFSPAYDRFNGERFGDAGEQGRRRWGYFLHRQ